MILYKWVNKDHTTKGGMKWEKGKANKALGISNELCTSGVLHAYKSKFLASFFGPMHTMQEDSILISVEASEIVTEDVTKVGTKEQTMIRVEEPISIPIPHRVEIAIRCSLLRFKNERYEKWAKNWLDGTDRTKATAAATYYTHTHTHTHT